MPSPVFTRPNLRQARAACARTLGSPLAKRLVRFGAARRGAVSMLFGLMCVVLFLAIGAGVDFGRWLHARTQTAAALDAAVLAAGRSLQVDRTDTTAAVATAKRFYQENTRSRFDLVEDTIDFAVVEDGNAVTASGAAYIETPFLKLAGIPRVQLLKLPGPGTCCRRTGAACFPPRADPAPTPT